MPDYADLPLSRREYNLKAQQAEVRHTPEQGERSKEGDK
jgi:hypothetical protein